MNPTSHSAHDAYIRHLKHEAESIFGADWRRTAEEILNSNIESRGWKRVFVDKAKKLDTSSNWRNIVQHLIKAEQAP
jgi:hypothetical protein